MVGGRRLQREITDVGLCWRCVSRELMPLKPGLRRHSETLPIKLTVSPPAGCVAGRCDQHGFQPGLHVELVLTSLKRSKL